MNLVTDWLLVCFVFISTYFCFLLGSGGIYVKPLFSWFSSVHWKGYRLYWWFHTQNLCCLSGEMPNLLFSFAAPEPLLPFHTCLLMVYLHYHFLQWIFFLDVLLDLIDYLDINYFFLSVWIFIFSANAVFAVTPIRKHTVELSYFKFMNIFLRGRGCALF